MQYIRSLDFLIREVVISDQDMGYIYVLNNGVCNGFYHIALCPGETTQLVLFSPSEDNGEEMVSKMLTLPMVRKNYLPILCTATDMVADLANISLC